MAWRQNADFITGYAEKGDIVTVNGSIQTGSYTDRDGRKVYTTDVLADRVQLVEAKKKSTSHQYHGERMAMSDIDTSEGFDTGPSDVNGPQEDDLPF